MKLNIEFNSSISSLQVNFIHMRLCLFITEKYDYDYGQILMIAKYSNLFSDFSLCYPQIIEVAEKLRDNNFMNINSLVRIMDYFNITDTVNDQNKFVNSAKLINNLIF